ncbi:MAG: DUF3293 domain-containing protein [Bacteroidota bacterium]|nr:DUF3293 domain-containing protein [Bacteroidota bacterium]
MIDPILIKAYLTTDYKVFNPILVIRIGQNNLDLDKFLILNHARDWAYITAYNPGSKLLSKEENEISHQKLLEEVVDYKIWEGEGITNNSTWEPEKSLLILGISKENAIRVSSKFGQNAFVFGETGKIAELIQLA